MELLRNFVLDICGAKPTGPPSTSSSPPSSASALRSATATPSAASPAGSIPASPPSSSPAPSATASPASSSTTASSAKTNSPKCRRPCANKLGLSVVAVDASQRFLTKLAGVTDPEQKRKIIGNEFIAVFDDEARRIFEPRSRHDEWLARPGHTLSRRHRVLQRPRPIADHQEPSQRRRPARRHEAQTHRAPPRPLQGRSPPHRPRPRHARGDHRPPALPRPRPRRPHPRRSHPRARRPPAGSRRIVIAEIRAAGLYRKIWQSLPCCSGKKCRRNGRPAHLRLHLRHPRRELRRRHDRRLGPAPLRGPPQPSPAASSAKSAASTASSTTSPPSPPAPSSGSNAPRPPPRVSGTLSRDGTFKIDPRSLPPHRRSRRRNLRPHRRRPTARTPGPVYANPPAQYGPYNGAFRPMALASPSPSPTPRTRCSTPTPLVPPLLDRHPRTRRRTPTRRQPRFPLR